MFGKFEVGRFAFLKLRGQSIKIVPKRNLFKETSGKETWREELCVLRNGYSQLHCWSQ
jgi:hypothetical protein